MKVRLASVDPSFPMARAKTIQVGNVTVSTPMRVLGLSKSCRCAFRTSSARPDATETYFKMTRERALGADFERFEHDTKKLLDKAGDALRLLIVEYVEDGRVPDAIVIDRLCDIACCAPGAVVIPPLANANTETSTKFAKAFAATAPTKPQSLLATIPAKIPGSVLDAGKALASEGIFSFVLNFNGHDPTAMPFVLDDIMQLTRHITGEYGVEPFFYAFNAQRTRVNKSSQVGEGRDMLSLATGIDCLGDMHTCARQVRRNGTRARRGAGPEGSLPYIRLFNSEDYGYYRVSDMIRLPNGRDVPRALIHEGTANARELAHAYNSEVHMLEAQRLRPHIEEGSLREYLMSKKHAVSTLDRLLRGFGDTRL